MSSVYTSRLEPTRTAEQALDKDHPLQRGADILTQKFPKVQEDPGSNIYFIWGLDVVDRSGVNQLFDPDFVGEPKFANDFEFNKKCQSKMLEACERLKTDDSFEGFIKRKDGLRNVRCFVEELGAFNVLKNGDSCNDVKKGEWKNEEWQVDPDNLTSLMDSFLWKDSCYGKSAIYSEYSDSMGWNGTALRYAGISFESDVLDPWSTLAEEVVREQYDKYFEFKKALDVSMAGDCQSSVIMTDLDQKFIFMNNQKIYRTSAISGSMFGVAIAFTVLLVSTKKLHIAFFATVSIFSVLVGVMGTVSMMGWTLGTNEAILVSILAGFSVDYVVHLAHAYVHSVGDVNERTKDAFGDMGISVFSGMLTSVVASIPLFMCTLTFFAKFGTCEFSTHFLIYIETMHCANFTIHNQSSMPDNCIILDICKLWIHEFIGAISNLREKRSKTDAIGGDECLYPCVFLVFGECEDRHNVHIYNNFVYIYKILKEIKMQYRHRYIFGCFNLSEGICVASTCRKTTCNRRNFHLDTNKWSRLQLRRILYLQSLQHSI